MPDDTTTSFEPSREQMAHVERLSIEHGSVKVKVDAARKLVHVTTDSPLRSTEEFVYDENGDDVTAKVNAPTMVEVKMPLALVERLVGPGPLGLALEGTDLALSFMRPMALGRVLGESILAEIGVLLDKAEGA